MSEFLKNLKAAADAVGTNQSETKSGGDFERVIYPEGAVKLRFVSYVELGKHEKVWQGKKTTPNKVRFGFEVSGPKHPPIIGNDGVPRPLVVYLDETLSLDPKANFVKLFSLLNHDRAVTHAVYKLGEPYIGKLVHHKFKRKTDPVDPEKWTGLDYRLRDANGYSIRPPYRDDPDTGETIAVQVGPALTPLAGFLWDAPDQGQWDSIFIDGEYPERKDEKGVVTAEARSKNVVQAKIMSAVNFKGSPIHDLLVKAGAKLDLAPPPEDESDEAAPPTQTEKPLAKPIPTGPASAGPTEDDIPW